jgi:hypothetical protein
MRGKPSYVFCSAISAAQAMNAKYAFNRMRVGHAHDESIDCVLYPRRDAEMRLAVTTAWRQ